MISLHRAPRSAFLSNHVRRSDHVPFLPRHLISARSSVAFGRERLFLARPRNPFRTRGGPRNIRGLAPATAQRGTAGVVFPAEHVHQTFPPRRDSLLAPARICSSFSCTDWSSALLSEDEMTGESIFSRSPYCFFGLRASSLFWVEQLVFLTSCEGGGAVCETARASAGAIALPKTAQA